MILRQAIIQFGQLPKQEKERLADRVSVFARSEDNIITHLNRHNIVMVFNPLCGYPKVKI